MFSQFDRITAAKSTHLSTNVGEEFVILNLVDEIYYGLDGVGALVWELLQQPRTVDEIVDVVSSQYNVDREQCERDVRALISELAQRSLVEAASPPDPQ